MRTPFKLLIAVAVLASGGYLYHRLSSSGQPDASAAKAGTPVPVLAAKAMARDMPIAVDLIGRGEAYESVSLMSRVDGQVQRVEYQEGQHVRAGEVLLHLDPSDFVARLRQAEATLAKDQALARQAEADAARYQALQKDGFVSQEKVTDMLASAAAAQATAKADQANLELARLQLSYTTLRAPISGIIGARLVFPGTAVKTNDTVLAVINRVQPLLVAFALPENRLGQMREARTEGALKASVSVPGDSSQLYQARVSFVDNAVDPTTGTLPMKVMLDNADERLSPGQYLRVTLILKTLKNAVVVPSQAVQQGPHGTVVYVVTPDHGITIRNVRVATSRNGMSALDSGVAAGETVVTDGHLKLTPKSKVKIMTADDSKPS